ncbi:MAG: response regulator transcription factor [Rubrobacter sp.]|jgi:two-component system nitrate/nitrite response regulator NarL|nr:response regulator transcription factor [Rubrobacter sp.]
MQRILLVEDHTSFRQTLAYVFDHQPGFQVVAQAGSLAEARRAMDGSEADLGVIDLSLPDGEGTDLIAQLREANPHFAALVLTASLDRAGHARAVEAGAAGVLHKSADVDVILDATRRMGEGETLLSQDELLELLRLAGQNREEELEARVSIEQITPREQEVLNCLAEGLSNKEIAAKLHMSVDTERTHMMNILNKLGVHSRIQALLFAARHGLVEIR